MKLLFFFKSSEFTPWVGVLNKEKKTTLWRKKTRIKAKPWQQTSMHKDHSALIFWWKINFTSAAKTKIVKMTGNHNRKGGRGQPHLKTCVAMQVFQSQGNRCHVVFLILLASMNRTTRNSTAHRLLKPFVFYPHLYVTMFFFCSRCIVLLLASAKSSDHIAAAQQCTR